MVSPAYRGENEIVTKDNVFYLNLISGGVNKKKKIFFRKLYLNLQKNLLEMIFLSLK